MNNFDKLKSVTKPMTDKEVNEMVFKKYSLNENISQSDTLSVARARKIFQSIADKETTQTQDSSGV